MDGGENQKDKSWCNVERLNRVSAINSDRFDFGLLHSVVDYIACNIVGLGFSILDTRYSILDFDTRLKTSLNKSEI